MSMLNYSTWLCANPGIIPLTNIIMFSPSFRIRYNPLGPPRTVLLAPSTQINTRERNFYEVHPVEIPVCSFSAAVSTNL